MNSKYIKSFPFLLLAVAINPIVTTKILKIDFIVHSYFYQLLTGLASFLSLFFCLVFLFSKDKIVLPFLKLQLNQYENYVTTYYINQKLNPNILAVYRVLFAIVNAVLIYRCFEFFDVLWFEIEYEQNINLLKTTLWIWAVTTLFLFVGLGGRWIGILQLLLSVFIMRNMYTFGIFELTHLTTSWAFVLLRTDSKFSLNSYFFKQKNILHFLSLKPQHTPILLLYILGIYFGFIFFLAGVDKLLDPLWFGGGGFYAFCVLPWSLPDYLKPIQESRIVMYLANYGSLVIEILFFPLFLFRKTRVISIVALTTLFIGLIYPFNIFFIGLYALLFGFLLISSFPFFTLSIEKDSVISHTTKIKNRTLIAFACVAIYFISYNYTKTLLGQTLNSITSMKSEKIILSEEYSQTNKLENMPTNNSASEERLTDLHLNELYSLSSILKTWFVRVTPVGLFSSGHLIGQYAYRVVITKKDGTKVEAIKYFMKDKSRGELDRNYFMLNILQCGMYAHGDMATALVQKTKLRDNYPTLYRFMHYSVKESNLEMSEIAYISTLVAPMKVPIKYEGIYKQNNTEWKEMIRFTENEGYRIIETPVAQPYQSRNPNLSNYLPRILYKNLGN